MSRVLICVFDALRPDLVTPDLMPNLVRFLADGAHYTRARSTFPTETRVNQSSLTTGCMPGRHGVVANRFPAPDLGLGLLNSGDDVQLEAAFAAGPVLSASTMGHMLADAGKRFAALSAGTPGGGRLIHWAAGQTGGLRLAMRRPEAAVPADLMDRIVARIGPMPGYALPATDWLGWAVRAYLDVIEPEERPDAMLLWLCEPDESFHWHGIGSPESRAAMAAADRLFGHILEVRAPAMAAGEMTVIALSDHGQITLDGPSLDLAGLLTEAGFPASTAHEDDKITVAVHSAGGLWVPGRDSDRIARLVRHVRAQPWAGPVFTRDGVDGTLRLSDIRLDHPRAPDIALCCRAGDATNAAGLVGRTVHGAPYPAEGGCHGGLHARELHTVLGLHGAGIRPGAVHAPAGVVDVLPTVLTLMDVDVPPGLDGRALTEALRDGPGPDSLDWRAHEMISTNSDGARTHLAVTDLGPHRYLDGAWVTA